MRNSIAILVDNILRAIGCKTINAQFMLSYVLIFILAAIAAISLYMSMAINPLIIDISGRQRMLSQRLAKEVLLEKSTIEMRGAVAQTIAIYERSHQLIINGDPAQNIAPMDNTAVLQQLNVTSTLWQQYKSVVLKYQAQADKNSLQQIGELSPEILQALNKTVTMMTDIAQRTTERQLMLSFICILLILVMIVLGRVLGFSMLMDNIVRLQKRMHEVGKGNFSHRFNISHIDNEVGQMFTAYNSMLDNVSRLLTIVQQVSNNTELHINEVVATTKELEHGVDQQYSDIALMASAITQLTSSVKEVMRSTQAAESEAKVTDTEAKKSGGMSHKSEQYSREMAETLAQTSATITALKEETQTVNSVSGVIKGIADQTNLLALNASIEAARAGDQGRGFAVVADEVRTLAQRTQQSTSQIDTIIQQLQNKAEQAVASMQVNNNLALTSRELAIESAQAMQQIVSSANKISSMNVMISTATHQQNNVVIDIDQRITNISNVASDTKKDTDQVVVSIEEIRREIQQLNALTSQFKLTAV